MPHFSPFSWPPKHEGLRPLLLAAAAGLLLAGCQTGHKSFSSLPMRPNRPLPVYNGIQYRHSDRPLKSTLEVPLSAVREAPPRSLLAVRPATAGGAGTAAAGRAQGLSARTAPPELTRKEDYSTSALDSDRLYAGIQSMYAADDTDSQGMREFKALKDSLDAALRKDGYSEAEIKQFYILNYLAAQQPNLQVRPKGADASRSRQAPKAYLALTESR